jgi:hypothetical protein
MHYKDYFGSILIFLQDTGRTYGLPYKNCLNSGKSPSPPHEIKKLARFQQINITCRLESPLQEVNWRFAV